MKVIKKIWKWIIVSLLALIALGTISSIACPIAIVIALLIVPVERWQNFLRKHIKRKIKNITIVVLVVLLFGSVPSVKTASSTNNSNETKSTNSVEAISTVKDSTIEKGTLLTTENNIKSDTNPNYDHTTLSTTKPKIKPNNKVPALPATKSSAATHTHTYSAATCTSPKTCTICGATEGKAKGHSWKEATCTSPKSCILCNVTEGSAIGHRWKNATYESPKTCNVCGKSEGKPLDVPGKQNYHGHVYTGGDSSKKYHYEEYCAGKYSHEISWEEVEQRNLGPCGTCVLK